MNGYVCIKGCTIGGVAYSKGDPIPFEAVLPSRERTLMSQGYISRSTNDINVAGTPKEASHLRNRVAELEETVKGMAELEAENTTLREKVDEYEKALSEGVENSFGKVIHDGITDIPEGMLGEELQIEEIKIKVPIITKEKVFEIEMPPENIVQAIEIIQMTAVEASAAVKKVDSKETLTLIDVIETRKTVKDAISDKVSDIIKAEETSTKGGDEATGKDDA